MILVAPDKFKGTFSAVEVAAAIAAGVRSAGGEARELPVADGGEGTAGVLAEARGGELRLAWVHDPLGRPIEAELALLGDGAAAVDAASASGLALLERGERDPWSASSSGTGELILAAAAAGAKSVIVGAGGTATVDGGAGAVEVLRSAGDLPRLVVACDARTPWEQAAEVYGPQKGADPAMVERLAARMNELATEAPRDPRGVEATGCAGGLSGALWAWFDAELVPGADYVLDAIGFDEAAAEADSIVTGEGRLDIQTLEGKAVAAIARRAEAANTPCDAIVAINDLGNHPNLPLRQILIGQDPRRPRSRRRRLRPLRGQTPLQVAHTKVPGT